ncbi:MAG: roadblock/LC7 domain-containing protein [Thermoplasmata archaeon]
MRRTKTFIYIPTFSFSSLQEEASGDFVKGCQGVNLMVDVEAIERIIEEVKLLEGVSSVVLVSRTGVHIAGDLPPGTHPETFVAMFAILLGAAETATSELREKLRNIGICLQTSKVLVVSDGPKALFVVMASREADEDNIIAELEKKSEALQEHL